MWIGGETRMTLNMFDMKGETDMCFKMPSPVKVSVDH